MPSPALIFRSGSKGTGQPDIVTYRLGTEMVYVPAAPSYDAAVTHAYDVFPRKLCGVDPEDVSFAIHVSVEGETETQCVRIGQQAWSVVLGSLVRYGLVDVLVGDATQPTLEKQGKSRKYGDLLGPPPGYTLGETRRDTKAVSAPDLVLPGRSSGSPDPESLGPLARSSRHFGFKKFFLGKIL